MTAISNHATARSKQRGIPPLIREWLIDYGDEIYDHHGGIIYHFTREARRKLEKNFGRDAVNRLNEWLNAYVVLSVEGGVLITAGIRYKKIRH